MLLLHPTFQDLQQHPRIEGSSAAYQDSGLLCNFLGSTHYKTHLGTCAPGDLDLVFFQCQWAVTFVQLFIPRQGLGRAFQGHRSILISFWMGEVEPYTKISPKACGPDGVTLLLTHPKTHQLLHFPPKTCSQWNPGVLRSPWVKIWIMQPCPSAQWSTQTH